MPDAGMIGVSLTDSGTELLGQRRGLEAYVADGKTMGIPLLYPWANRLGGNTYTAEDTTVTLTAGQHRVRADPNVMCVICHRSKRPLIPIATPPHPKFHRFHRT